MGTRVLGKDNKATRSLLCSKEFGVVGKMGLVSRLQYCGVWQGDTDWYLVLHGAEFGREMILPLATE